MYFSSNDFWDKDKRILNIVYDIRLEYKSISMEEAVSIASVEQSITEEDRNSYNIHKIATKRLYFIMYFLQNDYSKTLEYNHALRDFFTEIHLWLKDKPNDVKDEEMKYIYQTVRNYESKQTDKLLSLEEIKKKAKENRKLKDNMQTINQRMTYQPNNNLSKNERINAVATDILKSFPELERLTAEKLATMEPAIEPYKRKSDKYRVQIYRLINIMSCTYRNPNMDFVYNRALEQLKEANYKLKTLIGNNKDDIAINIVKEFNDYNQTFKGEFPTYTSVKCKIKKNNFTNQKK